NAPVFQEAIGEVISRHPVLRTSFELSRYTEPLQLVHGALELPVIVEDISHLAYEVQRDVIMELVESEKNTGFAWDRAPLFRLLIHKRSAETFQLTLSFHHAILDGWSLTALLSELFQLYLSINRGDKLRLPEKPAIQFARFVALEKEAIVSTEQKEFWTR